MGCPGQFEVRCEPLIGPERAAELLGIHPKTVKEKAAAGEIPGMKIGKLWRFRESTLDEFIRGRIECSGRSAVQKPVEARH